MIRAAVRRWPRPEGEHRPGKLRYRDAGHPDGLYGPIGVMLRTRQNTAADTPLSFWRVCVTATAPPTIGAINEQH